MDSPTVRIDRLFWKIAHQAKENLRKDATTGELAIEIERLLQELLKINRDRGLK
jgi:uncharacterized protein with von Willebrand factor type A (vWA) domain